jgi:hypothetical protein
MWGERVGGVIDSIDPERSTRLSFVLEKGLLFGSSFYSIHCIVQSMLPFS